MGISCADNKLTRKTATKGYYTLIGRSTAKSSCIIGHIKDKKTGKVISSANVSIVSYYNVGTITDEQGFYELEVVPGNIQIKVSNIGNSDLKSEVFKVRPKEQLIVNFYLGTFEIN